MADACGQSFDFNFKLIFNDSCFCMNNANHQVLFQAPLRVEKGACNVVKKETLDTKRNIPNSNLSAPCFSHNKVTVAQKQRAPLTPPGWAVSTINNPHCCFLISAFVFTQGRRTCGDCVSRYNTVCRR